jgi:hypothetical protein
MYGLGTVLSLYRPMILGMMRGLFSSHICSHPILGEAMNIWNLHKRGYFIFQANIQMKYEKKKPRKDFPSLSREKHMRKMFQRK